jgi:hypothetical protein
MRGLLVTLLLAAVPAQAAGLWTSACQDRQIQYQQIVGGDGFIHADNGNGTYTTVKLKQSFSSVKMICGTVPGKVADDETATVCADREHQTIRVLRGGDLKKGLKPDKSRELCQAVVNVN